MGAICTKETVVKNKQEENVVTHPQPSSTISHGISGAANSTGTPSHLVLPNSAATTTTTTTNNNNKESAGKSCGDGGSPNVKEPKKELTWLERAEAHKIRSAQLRKESADRQEEIRLLQEAQKLLAGSPKTISNAEAQAERSRQNCEKSGASFTK